MIIPESVRIGNVEYQVVYVPNLDENPVVCRYRINKDKGVVEISLNEDDGK